jgi:hypothetical protein
LLNQLRTLGRIFLDATRLIAKLAPSASNTAHVSRRRQLAPSAAIFQKLSLGHAASDVHHSISVPIAVTLGHRITEGVLLGDVGDGLVVLASRIDFSDAMVDRRFTDMAAPPVLRLDGREGYGQFQRETNHGVTSLVVSQG